MSPLVCLLTILGYSSLGVALTCISVMPYVEGDVKALRALNHSNP